MVKRIGQHPDFERVGPYCYSEEKPGWVFDRTSTCRTLESPLVSLSAQIGFVNHVGSLEGLQLGLLNWNDKGFLPVFPIFNVSR